MKASRQEIIRKYFRCPVEYAMGLADKDTLIRAVGMLNKIGAKIEDRKVVLPAREAAKNEYSITTRELMKHEIKPGIYKPRHLSKL